MRFSRVKTAFAMLAIAGGMVLTTPDLALAQRGGGHGGGGGGHEGGGAGGGGRSGGGGGGERGGGGGGGRSGGGPGGGGGASARINSGVGPAQVRTGGGEQLQMRGGPGQNQVRSGAGVGAGVNVGPAPSARVYSGGNNNGPRGQANNNGPRGQVDGQANNNGPRGQGDGRNNDGRGQWNGNDGRGPNGNNDGRYGNNNRYGNNYPGNNWYGNNYPYGGNRYGVGYRGYGGIGLGLAFGPYGYGYFPWYNGIGAYGRGGYGYGANYGGGYYNNGTYYSGAPTTVYQSDQAQATTQVAPAPTDDYVPQLNEAKIQLGARASGGAVLGVTMDPQYPTAAVVREAVPGGPAATAGLRPGDMITMIEQKQIESPNDVVNLVAGMQPGREIAMQFVRPVLRSEVQAAAPEVQPNAVQLGVPAEQGIQGVPAQPSPPPAPVPTPAP